MKKILIIEDDLSIAELERDYLNISGFETDICTSGDVGLRQAFSQDYHLILLDLMLPKIDGFEICRQIRSQLDIPILLISARKDDIDKIRGLGLGADDYITKPFSPSELVARVKAHLSRFERLAGGRDCSHEIIEVRGLKIDRTSRRVFIQDNEVQLTTREFDILQFLADNPNRVFSKEHLFDRLWGMDAYGDISTITVHIKRIREKIEPGCSKPQYIETVWGAGYRFNI